jgi:hypothetical protein
MLSEGCGVGLRLHVDSSAFSYRGLRGLYMSVLVGFGTEGVVSDDFDLISPSPSSDGGTFV